MKKVITFFVLVFLVGLVACTSPQTDRNSGIANPASVFCEEHGGKVEIITEAGGQRGDCVFSDGTRCDEWAYFRGECAFANNTK